MDSIKEQAKDPSYFALVAAALVSMITGFISEEGFLGWMQGFSIIVGLVILVGFGAANDFVKDRQFI